MAIIFFYYFINSMNAPLLGKTSLTSINKIISNRLHNYKNKNDILSIVNAIKQHSYLPFENTIKKEVLQYFATEKNISIKDFNKYVQSIDFDDLAKVAPRTKNFSSQQLIYFLDYYYKNNITKFTKEILTYTKNGGIDEFISNNYMTAEKLEKFYSIFPATKTQIGEIPSFLLDKIPQDKQEQAIEKIYEKLSNMQKNCTATNCTKTNTKRIQNELSGLLNKKINVKYIGKGGFGKTYKLSTQNSEECLCLKLFTNMQYFKKNSSYYSHGQFAEPQAGLFLNKHSNKFVKEYFGNIALPNEPKGFLVTQYLNNTTQPHTNSKITKGYKIDSNDRAIYHNLSKKNIIPEKGHNIINGKIIDYGGLEVKKTEFKKIYDAITKKDYSQYYVYKSNIE